MPLPDINTSVLYQIFGIVIAGFAVFWSVKKAIFLIADH